jgi:hypothetical protein
VPTRKRSSRPRGVSRIDQPSTRTFGWFVRVGYHKRRDGSYGPKHTKFFGDAGNGGKKKALAAAEKFLKGLPATKKKAPAKKKSAARKKK